MRRAATMLSALLALLLFCLAGLVNGRMDSRNLGTAEGGAQLDSAPTGVLFATVLLGGFRGLLADVLWLRGSYLQDEGRYFELVQIAGWVTQLEPEAEEVWTFHAWNMAYNVSVMMPDPSERWRWVLNGVELLRDGAIRANPGSGRLHAELAWLFQHKIGAEYDPAYPFYRRSWAALVESVVPGGLLEGGGGDVLSPDADARCRRVLGMDSSVMREIDEKLGPLDWRVPQAHAVYWAWVGREVAAREDPSRVRLERLIYQNMARLFFAGALDRRQESDPWVDYVPRPDLLEGVLAAFASASATYPDDPNIAAAYDAFLSAGVVYFHFTSAAASSQRLYRLLRERRSPGRSLPDTVTAFAEAPEVLGSLPPYVTAAIDRSRKSANKENLQ